MMSPPKPLQHMISLFEQQPCWKINPLATELRYAVPSVRRFLVQAAYFSSFTHNGAWYTLASIPQFNREGLWFYQEIGFSKAGNLTGTIIDLIRRSHAGMTAEEIGDNLCCRCHSVLVNLYRQEKIQRQKLGRSYIYFAADPHTANRQRRAITLQKMPADSLPAEIAVFILAEFIKRPTADFNQLAEVISKRGVAVNTLQIEKLFEQHGLKKRRKWREQALQALRHSLDRLSKETSPAALFRHPPVIRFVPQTDTCSCGQRPVVQKTRRKTVLSMTGPFVAHETLLQCPKCQTVFNSDQLRRIVPPRCNTAYDVMVFVGKALFQRYRTTCEILAELADRNVFISASEVLYLGRKFIMLLAEAHRLATPDSPRDDICRRLYPSY